MSLVSAIMPNGKSGFGYGSTAEDVTDGVDLTGKTYLITGCNSGIGLETMRVLTMRGATVLAAARTVEKAQNAGQQTGGDTIPVACELSDPDSVKAAVETVKGLDKELDGIIANAGIMALPKLELVHGYDKQFFTNHIGHFILVTGLLETLADNGRVVMLSSDAHKSTRSGGVQLDNLDGSKGYQGWLNYGQSKLCNLLFAKELSTRVKPNQVACAVHPGVIQTNLARHMSTLTKIALSIGNPLFLKSIPQGAATQTWAAANPQSREVINGQYLADCNVATPSKYGRDMRLAKALWEKSEEIVSQL